MNNDAQQKWIVGLVVPLGLVAFGGYCLITGTFPAGGRFTTTTDVTGTPGKLLSLLIILVGCGLHLCRFYRRGVTLVLGIALFVGAALALISSIAMRFSLIN